VLKWKLICTTVIDAGKYSKSTTLYKNKIAIVSFFRPEFLLLITMKNPLKLTAAHYGILFLSFSWIGIHSGCTSETQARVPNAGTANVAASPPSENPAKEVADAATILERPEVPVLCYHQVRDFRPTDGPMGKAYTVPVATFKQQMQALADNGYHAILPDQLYDYLAFGTELPANPVMITFDDTRLDQFTAALPELNKHGFKAAFFIMTVSLGRPGYMSKEQVRKLSDEGHTIGSHTYDHQNVKKYTQKDWEQQVAKPSKLLKEITGKPIEYFAYPFGLWNKEAIPHLKEHGFKSVFQLSDRPDQDDPLFSVRRIIVPGAMSAPAMLKAMKSSFH
jgi:peptidoglycan/xylan/chitin deacetylase (PgdA/CDA1 family)